MRIYSENKLQKISSSEPKRPMTLKLGIQHRVLEYYQCFHMITLCCVDLDRFYDRVKFVSECFCMGESISKFVLIQHILGTQVNNTGPKDIWLKNVLPLTNFGMDFLFSGNNGNNKYAEL